MDRPRGPAPLRTAAIALTSALAGGGLYALATHAASGRPSPTSPQRDVGVAAAPPDAGPLPGDAGAAAPASPPQATGGPGAHARGGDALAALDARIEAERRAALARPDWVQWERVASLYRDRARASGDWSDFRRAEKALDRAFELAPAGTGPHLARAAFNYAMHRLARVGPDLDRVEAYAVVSPSDRAAVASLRADVAFHSGRYDEARTLYEAQLARGRTASALAAYAQWFWKTGDPRRAEALLREAAAASEREPASTRAWICLVQGLFELDRGRHDAALAHYRRGLEHTPNDWLLQEHLAEALALRGDGVIALPLYERLVDRTGSPEFMDAVAEILLERGDREAAAPWIARARAAWEERLALYPEAAYGHALDHWLTLEREPERTVQMAEANAEARPNGESLTKLAQALLAAGRTADARRAIEQVLASRWSTPETHELAAQVYDAAGEPRLAQRQRDRAAALR